MIIRGVSDYSKFNSYKSIARDKENLGGGKELVFSRRFVSLFDDAVVHNNLDVLSKEQLAMVNAYLVEADGVLSDKSKQLDTFLGGI